MSELTKRQLNKLRMLAEARLFLEQQKTQRLHEGLAGIREVIEQNEEIEPEACPELLDQLGDDIDELLAEQEKFR
jgi:hypothetical protein